MSRTPIGGRCILFFPGDRAELLPKALASGAGRVCMDLEDAVRRASKEEARTAVLSHLTRHDQEAGRFVVRINHPSTDAGALDLQGIGRVGRARVTLMVPKVDGRDEVDAVRLRLGREDVTAELIPVIETARGLANVEEIAAAEAVSAIVFGGLDLSVDLGCAMEWESLLYARSRTVHAARLGGVDAVDTPFFDVEDPEGLRREADRARRLGFATKAAIHPRQVEIIEEAFAPTEAELARARSVVEAFDRGGAGAFLLDGTMIDRPAIDAARDLLGRTDTTDD